FFTDTVPPQLYTLSLHDALPIYFTAKAILDRSNVTDAVIVQTGGYPESMTALTTNAIAGAMIPAPQSVVLREKGFRELVSIKQIDRKSTRLNSSHVSISYAVFCL